MQRSLLGNHQRSRRMMMKRFGIVSVVSLLLVTAAVAQQPAGDDQALPKGFKVTPVLKTGKTASDAKLEDPRTAQAEVISVIGGVGSGRGGARRHPPGPALFCLP